MTTLSCKTIRASAKSSHQQISLNGETVGEVWREQAVVIVSKLRAPLRQEKRWRWFAKASPDTTILGRNRTALIGPGFPSKEKALEALESFLSAGTNQPTAY